MPAGRPKGTGGYKLTNEHRGKIRNSSILNALIENVEGKREMSATQVSAGLGLLKKALPDLAAIELSSNPDNPVVHQHKVEQELERFTRKIAEAAATNGTQ